MQPFSFFMVWIFFPPLHSFFNFCVFLLFLVHPTFLFP
uniref:Uncharacterized protein n=1 Tax=Anguilla anguilla TaxID=7936 RepID=A0A0E9QTV8_ANGAN